MATRRYETAIAIGAQIAKNFRGDTLNAAKAIDQLAQTTKKLKQAEAAAGAFKKLDAAVTSSKARLDQTSAALRRLKDAEAAAGGATKESTKWIKAGEREVAAAGREFDRATKAAERNAEALRKVGVNTANLVREQKRLQAAAQFATARDRIFGEKRTDKTPLIAKAGQQLAGVARDVAMLSTAAAGAGVAMTTLVLKSLKAGDEIGDTADKLGIGTTALQELRYGAEQAGAEAGSLDKALAKMAVSVGKFKNAKGGAAVLALGGVSMLGTGGQASAEQDPFKRIGLNAKALAALKPEEQLKRVADGMAKLKTHADKAAVAQGIFGKGATELLPYLEEGSAGIERYAKAAHKYGGVMTPEQIRQADLADKALRDAKLAVAGLANSLGASLLPTATKTFETFSQWVANNREQIQKWAATAATWIEGKGIPALKKIGETVATVATTVAKLVDYFGAGNVVLAATAFRLAPLAGTLVKINAQLIKAATGWTNYAKGAAEAGNAEGPKAAGAVLGKAASAAMLIEAASIGFAIGKAIDEHFHISDKIVDSVRKQSGQVEAEKKLADTVANTHKLKLAAEQTRRAGIIGDYIQKGLPLGQAIFAADKQIELQKMGSRGAITVAPNITIQIGAGATDEDIESQLAAALLKVNGKVTEHVARKVKEHEKQKRRVSYD